MAGGLCKNNMNKNKDIFTKLLICDQSAIILPRQASHILSDLEQARLANISHPQQAQLFLLGRYLARHLLSSVLQVAPEQINIRVDAKGKPQLEHAGYHFNISHSGSLLALAVSNQGSVGIDIEGRQLSSVQIQRLAKRYFNADEQAWLAQHSSVSHFLQLWTIKEAVVKAAGTGLANQVQQVLWQPPQAHAALLQQHYRLYQYQVAQSWLTLAVDGEPQLAPEAIFLSDLPLALEMTAPQPNLILNP